jgi:hypothetical protein
MGISPEQYPRFKEFNRWVIKGPVEEINEVTDFHVEADYLRKGRGDKVVAVKFRIRRVLDVRQLGKGTVPWLTDLEDMPLAVKALKDAGLSAKDAWDIWRGGFAGVDVEQRPAIPAAGCRQREQQHRVSPGGDQAELRQS